MGRVPGLRVLGVGRRPLAVADERVCPLPPLGGDEAAELLLNRAAWQGWAVAHGPELPELCEAMARERLGDPRYASCVAEGARLVREAAVPRALERPQAAVPAPRGPVRHATASVNMHEPAASPTRKGGETAG